MALCLLLTLKLPYGKQCTCVSTSHHASKFTDLHMKVQFAEHPEEDMGEKAYKKKWTVRGMSSKFKLSVSRDPPSPRAPPFFLEIEHRASHILGKCSNTKLDSSSLFETGSH